MNNLEVNMIKVTDKLNTSAIILKNGLDYEWALLILEAKRIGLTTEELREFLLCKKT